MQLKLSHIFGLRVRDLHIFTERVGGGFGGKQEMVSEDLCLLATLKTGRPVKWELTREEEFIGATTRHQMTTRVKLGAKRDGTLTAIDIHVVSNTGGYGGHASETLAASLGSPMAAYRCANKKAVGYAVYTNMVPGGGFRGYGSSQTTFAIESAIDELGRLLGMSPFEIRRKNMVRPTDWIESVWKDPSDASFGSYGLDQCLDLVEKTLVSGGGDPKPTGEIGWRAPASRWRCWIVDRRPSTDRERRWRFCPMAAITLQSARPKWATDRSLHTGRSPPPSLVREARASPSSTRTPT